MECPTARFLEASLVPDLAPTTRGGRQCALWDVCLSCSALAETGGLSRSAPNECMSAKLFTRGSQLSIDAKFVLRCYGTVSCTCFELNYDEVNR